MTFVLLSGLLHAQYDDEEGDTTVTDLEEMVAEPETDTPSDTYQPETPTDYFLRKWMPGSGIDSLYQRRLSDSAVAALHSDDDYWYANHVFEKKQEKRTATRTHTKRNSNDGLLLFLIIGGFVAFLAMYLVNSNIGLFRRSRSIYGGDADDPEMDDIFAINYDREIEKAVQAGNYRLAVRLMFLRLLRQLSDKNVIQYTQDRTNFDYLMQLSNTEWYQPFLRLARNYEYVWYGKFAIDDKQFHTIKNEFASLDRQS